MTSAAASRHHLDIVLDKLVAAGAEVDVDERVHGCGSSAGSTSFDVVTLPYPGFPTDLQPFAMALAAVATGTAMITENVFEARFMFAQELARLGADLRTDGHHAVVRGAADALRRPGESPTTSAPGAALVLAGLAAQGTTDGGRVARTSTAATPGSWRLLSGLGADISPGPDVPDAGALRCRLPGHPRHDRALRMRHSGVHGRPDGGCPAWRELDGCSSSPSVRRSCLSGHFDGRSTDEVRAALAT